MKIKNTQRSKTVNKGFTLIELLVVVLIIGILAAIALPQYKLAVAKSKFSTIKTIAKNIQESMQRYYLTNGTYTGATLDIEIPKQYTCINNASNNTVRCSLKISWVVIAYYINIDTGKPKYCLVYSVDETDILNRLCQKETGKRYDPRECSTVYCRYLY